MLERIQKFVDVLKWPKDRQPNHHHYLKAVSQGQDKDKDGAGLIKMNVK